MCVYGVFITETAHPCGIQAIYVLSCGLNPAPGPLRTVWRILLQIHGSPGSDLPTVRACCIDTGPHECLQKIIQPCGQLHAFLPGIGREAQAS